MIFVFICKPVLSNHLSYVTIFHCSLGRSHKTVLTVLQYSECLKSYWFLFIKEAGNWRKSPVILAVTAGYFFSLKKIMRENLVSAIQRTVRVSTDQHVCVCRSIIHHFLELQGEKTIQCNYCKFNMLRNCPNFCCHDNLNAI
jgi:hypothetical protein